MEYKTVLQSKKFRLIIRIIALCVLILFVFKIGMIVGYQKANFSYKWGENYHRNFGGPRNGFFSTMLGKDFIDAHGVFGQIIKKDNTTVIIKGQNDIEKIIATNDATVIKRGQDTVSIADLTTNEYIVVLGAPNDNGQIDAKLIRILPERNASTTPHMFPWRMW